MRDRTCPLYDRIIIALLDGQDDVAGALRYAERVERECAAASSGADVRRLLPSLRQGQNPYAPGPVILDLSKKR